MKIDYLKPAIGEVVEGLEDHEKIYALEQGQYVPLRTLLGEHGKSAIYRCELTAEQRAMVAAGADVLVEILTFGGPLAPSRVMLIDQGAVDDSRRPYWLNWLKAQLKLAVQHDTR